MDAVADPECAVTENGGPLDPRSFLGILSALPQNDDGGSGATLLLLRPRWGAEAPGAELAGRLARRLREGLGIRHELGRFEDGRLGLLLRVPDEPEAAVSVLDHVRAAAGACATWAGLGIGVAVYPRDGRTGEALLETASRSLWLFDRLTREVWPWPDPSRAAAMAHLIDSDGTREEEIHDFSA